MHILLYSDEFEVCNPIGVSKNKYKLLAVYYRIIDFHGKHTSLERNNHLLLLAKSTTVKSIGINEVFSPLLNELNQLYFYGIQLGDRLCFVIACFMTGDNLSQNLIGGFTTSFSRSNFCRYCTAHSNNAFESFDSSNFRLRTHVDIENSALTRSEGMKQLSPFLDLPYVKLPFLRTDKSIKTLQTQVHCLFQIMTYHIHKGRQKTPMHAMVGQSVYGKTRSRVLITTLNRIGVSTSYNEVRRARSLLSSYAVHRSEADGTPIPSHFNGCDFCIGAMDNSDYSDESSLSGTHSKHYTAMVLFQEKVNAAAVKPKVSSTGLSKSSVPIGQKLRCQIVPHHSKSVVRPSLSPEFVLRENSNLGLCNPEQVAKDADKTEFVITLVRSEIPNLTTIQPGELPTWGGIHALVSEANVPLMRVGFLPMIPKPVTEYATVRKALTNFQSVRQQLNQCILPVFSDEGVFKEVTEVVMTEPDTFADIYPMM